MSRALQLASRSRDPDLRRGMGSLGLSVSAGLLKLPKTPSPARAVIGARYHPHCFLARYGLFEGTQMPPCEGRLVRVHLIPAQELKRRKKWEHSELDVWDLAILVLGCGGVMGNGGHHGHFDYSRRLRLPRKAIPDSTEAFAERYGLVSYLDRAYGPSKGG